MAILVNNLQEIITIKDEIPCLLETILQKGLIMHQKPKAEVSVVLVTDEYIREMNLKYRNLDRPTDVLSFAMEEGATFSTAYIPEGVPELLGDIYISLERAVAQADEYGHSFERELCYLAVHGLLHLLGYDHQTKEKTGIMREAEEKILEGFNLGVSK